MSHTDLYYFLRKGFLSVKERKTLPFYFRIQWRNYFTEPGFSEPHYLTSGDEAKRKTNSLLAGRSVNGTDSIIVDLCVKPNKAKSTSKPYVMIEVYYWDSDGALVTPGETFRKKAAPYLKEAGIPDDWLRLRSWPTETEEQKKAEGASK